MIEESPGRDGRPVLLLLHGMGATGDVWLPGASLLEQQWPGRWSAPDLAGHGGASALPEYSFAGLAGRVAGGLGAGDRVVVLGHSLGGVVGLALAAASQGVPVDAVVGLGIKAVWSPEELARAGDLATRPVTWFATRGEAARRYLRVSGLAGLVAPDHPMVDAGLRQADGRWRLAMDPAAFAVGEPDLTALLAAIDVPVLLARGEHDPMVSDAQLKEYGVPVATLPGLGHNAHVEDPAAVLALLDTVRPHPKTSRAAPPRSGEGAHGVGADGPA
ncbi:alpha/beta fold hydrolase [Micromonospora sp. CA-263727]|uniref:alpha/beta fold hydrolase n=1 Tax=Micromonospora sp. CA-263727 TaxID=3239967 RepID=UPI003D90FDB4